MFVLYLAWMNTTAINKYIGAQGNNMTEKESNEAYWGNILRMRCMHCMKEIREGSAFEDA